MNAKEGVDLAKMAIAVMLTILALSAVFMLWYFLYDEESALQDSLNAATLSAATERLYEMQDATFVADDSKEYEDYPLVSNVCSTLSEYNEDGLLFIYCTARDVSTGKYSDSHWYTYDGVVLKSLPSSFPGVATATQLYPNTQIPVTYAVKSLLPYSQYRCRLQLVDYDYEGLTYTGVIIEVLVKEV